MIIPRRHPLVIGSGLLLLLLLTMAAAAGMGYVSVPVAGVARVVAGKMGFGDITALDPVVVAVVADVRLPRILAAVVVGGVLAVSGTVFQGVLLNPLADPYTLGISSGAAFGASLALVASMIGLPFSGRLFLPLCAFGGAVATLAAVLALAAGDRTLSSTSLILSGVIVAAILSAAIGFLKFIADEQVGVIIFWLMGSLAGVGAGDFLILLPVTLAGLAVIFYHAGDLNIMATGERCADTLGVETVRVRKILLTCCSLMTALCVAVAGIIGFVGLVVPHLLRLLVGPDNRALLPLSFLGGGLLLLFADTLTRAVLPAEVPIGVLTALLGGPFFCWIFYRRERRHG